MASSTDYVCDLTGEVLKLSDLPIVVRLTVGVVPGALVDPRPDSLPPFLRRMLFHQDGRNRVGVLELGAHAFDRHFLVRDLAALEPAFDGPPASQEELAQLRATVDALQAQRQVLEAQVASQAAALQSVAVARETVAEGGGG